MNILILNWRDIKNPHAGGAEIVTHEHAKFWVKSGNKVTYFSSYFSGARIEDKIDGVNIIRRGSSIFGVQIQVFFWYLFGRHEQFDLVIDQFHGIPFFTPLYVRTEKIAFIHEVAKDVWKYNPWPKPFNLIPTIVGGIFEKWMFRLMYKNIPFMTVSESTRDDLVRWGIPSSQITIIHNGVSQPPVTKREKEKRKTIMYLGAIAEDKGIYDAMKVFSILHNLDCDYEFWVVGKGERRIMDRLQKMADDLGINNNIKFWGYVDEQMKNELLTRAQVLINLSVREGWGLVVIEAAYYGSPTVAYDVPGLRNSIKNGKTGILVTKGSLEDVADKIISLLKDHEKYENLQKECIKWAKSLPWSQSTQKSLEFINKITKN
jgi:glycosyltransferase involved in cell wall biosynthesis